VPQIWEQQSLGELHAEPSDKHWVPPQKPLPHASPPQHARLAEHGDPFVAHGVPPQKPPTQSSPQQSVVRVHAAPSGAQIFAGLHVPATHESSAQHWPLVVQLSPEAWQDVPPPAPGPLPPGPEGPAPKPRRGVRSPQAGTTRAARLPRSRAKAAL